MREFQPAWPLTTPEVRDEIEALLANGAWGWYEGPALERLTSRLCERFLAQSVYPCSSGTVAVELALRGLGVKPGDEVVLAAYDFPGNFRAVEAVGARPVLVDLQSGSWTLSVDATLNALGPETRAVIASHLHGCVIPMDRLVGPCQERGVAVVEDICQCPGASYRGQLLGTFGDVAVLSFGGSKLLTSGRGGAVLTSQPAVAQRIKIFAERGNLAFPLSELQAAVLLPQLETLDRDRQRRNRAVERLTARLAERNDAATGVVGPSREANADPDYYKVPWRLEDPLRRDVLLQRAWQAGVPLDRGFRGFTRRSRGRCRIAGSLDQAQGAAEGTVLLHHPVLLSDDEILTRLGDVLGELFATDEAWSER